VIAMNWRKIIKALSKLNLIGRYKEYKYQLKVLQDNNTTEIAKFLEMDNEKRDITLFCLTAALKIKQESMSKLLYAILTASIAGTGIATYAGVT
jgi:hypothetical protein